MLSRTDIVKLLQTNDFAIVRALLVLNANQTADERQCQMTRHHNGKGFRPCHAHMGVSMAQFYERNGFLSPKQIAYWRRLDRKGNMKIAIYWRQLAEAAEQKRREEIEKFPADMKAMDKVAA